MPARYTVLARLTCLFSLTFAYASASNVVVMPASATLSPGQTFVFSAAITGGMNAGVTWSMSPQIGTMSNGSYTAPSTISAPETVVLTAASLGNGNQKGTAVISLMPLTAPTPTPGPSGPLTLSPPTASASANQSISFSALYNGAPTSKVTWSISPKVGTITSDGTYQAPVAISTSQVITITATYFKDSSAATATVTLIAPNGGPPVTGPSVFITPASVTLGASQGASFQAGITGAVNSGVSWSLSPAVGTISNGYYQAPSSIPSSETVMLTATSLSNPALKSSAAIYLLGSPAPAPSPSPSPSPTPTSTSMQLSPSTISLSPQQSATFTVSTTGGLSTAVTWSVVPSTMGTISNGVYTAPASISAQTNVTVIATSTSNPTMSASAAVVLQPNVTPPPTVSVSLTPSSVTLSSGQTTQFTPTVTGSSNTAVTWTVSPSVGSVSAGQYTAPSSVTIQQVVTVTATSAADPTKSASGIIMLMPSSVSLSPQTISLAAGKSVQFTASVTGPSNTAVTWSISPAVGSISNGLYIAPASVSTAQNVVVTVSSVASPTTTAQATISLTASAPTGIQVSPTSASLAASQGQQFSVSSTGIGGSGVSNVTWSINPQVGAISSSGMYTAPSSISSQQTVVVTASSSGLTATANVTLTPPASQPPTPAPPSPSSSPSGTVTLPIEVMGAAGTTVPVTVTIPSGTNVSGQLQLSLQIHGLKYQTEASVQFNGGTWIPINSSTVTIGGYAAKFGGIGGGFATLNLTMNIPAGAIVQGQNTITFQFIGTDGITSGYRVLNFNILSGSTQLLASSAFTNDDPTQWQPPLNDATDIQAGQTLWSTGSLTTPGGAIQSHCSDCHTIDGRDLKYFNYSNNSIIARSMFHGLSQQQGQQIASYIRSLNTPAPANGRPWNPPYQPGPGLDSQPVTNWSAGAGLGAVLAQDSEMLAYEMPGGSTANLGINGYMNAREMPIAVQLLDWNRWLPTVGPIDGWGSQFAPIIATYQDIRSKLQPNNPTAYANTVMEMYNWMTSLTTMDIANVPASSSTAWADGSLARKTYSDRLWGMVKLWELNQEFGLEGMAQAVMGPTSAQHAWDTNEAFFTSPNFAKIPAGNPGIANGTLSAFEYIAFAWYQIQLILNDGQRQASGTFPIDWGYAIAYPGNSLTWDGVITNTTLMGTAGLMLEWLSKSLQSGDGVNEIFLQNSMPYYLVLMPAVPSTWSELSPSQTTQIMNTWTSIWFSAVQSQTPAQVFSGMGSPAFSLTAPGSFTGDLAAALPALNYLGVSQSLLNQIANWAAGIWPTYNWSADVTQSCSISNLGFIGCP